MQYYLYEIAGIRVLCQIPQLITIQKESKNFLRLLKENEIPVNVDQKIIFRECTEIPDVWKYGHREINNYYLEDKVFLCDAPNSEPYAYLERTDNWKAAVFYYTKGSEYHFKYSHNIIDLIGLEAVLLHHQGLLLHSSFIRWQNQGILFSAPSGTGKSTQADLWEKYENAEIINGDRAGVRLMDSQWRAYGLPYAGSSGIYKNESAPIRAIVALRQAKENRIRKISAIEAVNYLYPEFTIHRWDKKFTEKALDCMLELFAKVPVYLLECLPDAEAVQLLKDTLQVGKD